MRSGQVFRKSFRQGRTGVSEIVGDVLLVSIAVVMMGALAAQLGTLDPPEDRVMASLDATYDGSNVTVAHRGGDALTNQTTRFYLFTNDTFKASRTVADGRGGGARFSVGQTWSVPYASNSTDVIRLQIIDEVGHRVIFNKIVQRGPEAAGLPDLGLSAQDIYLIRGNGTINESGNFPMTNETITINCTIHNYGGAPVPNVQVRVTDYSTLDLRTYDVGNRTIPLLNASDAANISMSYRIENGSWGLHAINVKVIPVFNESRYANNYATKQYRVGYPVMASSPTRPYLRIRDIDFSSDHPAHGSTIVISSRIINQGGVPATATVRYYDNNKGTLIGTDSGLGVPVGGESLSSVFWKTSSGGLHTIIVNVTDPNATGDERTAQIEVLSTILVVDDDRASEGSPRDVVTPMLAGLQAVGATYGVHAVGGGDGPRYEGGEHPLVEYDLVIWMTGFEEANTLTGNDQSELTRYLHESRGRLWLIGQDVVSDLGYGNAFLGSRMQLDPATPYPLNAGTPTPLQGDRILTGTNFTFGTPFTGGLSNRGDFVQNTSRSAYALIERDGAQRPVGLLFNATTNGSSETYMASLFSFELGKVSSPNDRSLIIYSMLEWFNCSARWGRDLAISNMRFNVTNPSFMEKVNITVWVRNNGLNDEPPGFVSPILQIGFYMDGKTFDPDSVSVERGPVTYTFTYPTSEIWIPQSTPDPGMVINGRGGYIKVSAAWVASKVGEHNVTVRVDPYDYIDENNELNNQVDPSICDGKLFVRYGTLLVDDDDSPNNRLGATNYNATQNISQALDALGYDYDLFVVPDPAADGPAPARLEQYNAIIWCSGQSASSLTAADQANLESYLKKSDGRYLWFVGQDAVPVGNYFDGAQAFFRDFLRVARVTDPAAPKTPSFLMGVDQDPVSHGMRMPATPTFADSGGRLVPYIDGEGILYQSPMPDLNSMNRETYCDAEDRSTAGWYNRINPVGTTNTISNVDDPARGSRVIRLERSGVNVQDSSFLLGDHAPSLDWNPQDLPWLDRDRWVAQWSFCFAIDYTVGFHVTDTLSGHHILYYSNTDTNLSGADPEFGLGAWTADGLWHTATRDLLLDLREGTGNGALNIASVDGFEVWMNVGTGLLDGLSLNRPYNSVRYSNSEFNFKTVFTAWDPSFVSYSTDQSYSMELVYMIMSWFNLYDERTELRITFQDLYFGNMVPLRQMKPMIGESYVLKAVVWNPGGTRGDAVVRFMDSTTVIDSVTVSVDAGSRALAEIVWTPLFAGSRTVGAVVDPDNSVAEVMKFNNRASINIQCYFFFDDLESGTVNWNHDATLLRINGETPLEYMDPGTVNTNIVRDWSASLGVCATTSDYRTYPRSYRMLAPAVEDYTYTFFLTYDPWNVSFAQGYYIVAIKKEASYTVERFNTGTLEYDLLYTGILAKGRVAIYHQQTAGALYRIHSTGPLLVVVTSSEGSNVNVANHDDGLACGRNFTVMGDLAGRLGGDTHVAAIALEDNTQVTVTWVAISALPGTYGATLETDVSGNLMAGERWHTYLGAPHSYAVANVTATKPILLYRISNDNDEADNAMSTTGYTYGKELYFVMYRSNGGWPWRFLVSNIEDAQALDIDIYESTEASGWGGWSLLNQRVDPHSSRVFSRMGPPNDNSLHYFRITSDRNITVVFGQEQHAGKAFANNCPRYQDHFYADGVWDYRLVTEQPGFYRMSTPQLYGTNTAQAANRLYNLYQDFSFGTAITIDIDPGLPVLGSLNGVNQNGLRYLSTVPVYVTVMGTGPLSVNQSMLDATIWVPYDLDGSGFANFTLPAGAHTFQWRTVFGGGAGLQIVRFATDSGGEFVWQLWPTIGNPPGTGFDESTSDFDDNHWWNFTANHRFLYLVGGSGNCWIHTILPFEGAVETPGIMRSVEGAGPQASEPQTSEARLGEDDRRSSGSGERAAGSGGEGGAGGRANEDFYIVTQPFSLVGYSSAGLSFYQRYSMQVGANGVVIMVGNDTAGDNNYKYRYVTPTRPYTGNIRFDIPASRIRDDFGREMRWCYNGVSTNGLGGWDYITVDLSPFIGQVHVKVKFLYLNATMTGVGYWYIDDVVVKAGRGDAAGPTTSVDDQWELVTRGTPLGGTDVADSFSGVRAWLCHNPSAGVDHLKGGIDNSLTTVPIDLTNALDAALHCNLKFNINASDGRPPDGFRVEVSSDNGETWTALNRGVRSSSGLSGSLAAGPDGTSMTGVNILDNWVAGNTLSRLNCDLSGWAGSVILLRFRVVTRTDIATHYESAGAGFGGIYIDDVQVVGNTTTGGGRAVRSQPGGGPVPDSHHSSDGAGKMQGGAGPGETPGDGGTAATGEAAGPLQAPAGDAGGPPRSCLPAATRAARFHAPGGDRR